MADKDEDIDIDIDLDAKIEPDAEEIEVVKTDEPEAAEEKADVEPLEGLETLRENLERERQARIAAEARAQQHAEQAYRAQGEVQDSNLYLVNNAIETITQNAAQLRQNYAVAMQNQDFETAAEIQEAMGANSARLLQLEQGKQAMEAQERPAAPPPQYADPLEALTSQLSYRSAEWVRGHPEYASDPRLYKKMVAAHELAVADDLQPDTDDYFAAIESTLRIRTAIQGELAESRPARRAPPAAAPVTRSGNGTGARPNIVRLTAAEREAAADSGVTEKEYAQQKLRMQREQAGKLN